jgi:hypothetical protein
MNCLQIRINEVVCGLSEPRDVAKIFGELC